MAKSAGGWGEEVEGGGKNNHHHKQNKKTTKTKNNPKTQTNLTVHFCLSLHITVKPCLRRQCLHKQEYLYANRFMSLPKLREKNRKMIFLLHTSNGGKSQTAAVGYHDLMTEFSFPVNTQNPNA